MAQSGPFMSHSADQGELAGRERLVLVMRFELGTIALPSGDDALAAAAARKAHGREIKVRCDVSHYR
jgi:hypothetical protein